MILRHVNIEPTNRCPLNCSYCGDRKERETGFMSLSMYKRILNMIPHRTEVRLFISGEPFLHPNIDKMIGMACSKGHIVLIHSNGHLPNLGIIEKVSNVAKLFPHSIFINFTVHGNTVPLPVNLMVYNKDIKISLQKIIPYPEPLKIPEYMKPFEGIVPIHLRYPHNWDKDEIIKEAAPKEVHEYNGVCGFLEDSVAIYWNGDVTVCCADLNGDKLIGHIDDGWDSIEKKYDSLAKSFGTNPHICEGCERYANGS